MRASREQQQGFTLIELMVVVSIIGVLSILGVPHFRAYLLDARLSDAVPYLTDIAARNRMHFIETGKYCCDLDPTNEKNIIGELRAPLDDVGDFCFMIVCKDSNLCPIVTAPNFIAADEAADAGAEFEVWALLRQVSTGSIDGPSGSTCKVQATKRPPTGLAEPAASGKPGRQGQAVVLRYPAPANGLDTTTGNGGHRYNWDAGISKTNALHP